MKISRYLLPISLLAFAIGAGFAPWIYRPAVAEQLTAPGLAEFVKFLAEKRLGLLPIQRLHFLLPAATAALVLPLFAVNRQLRLNWSANALLRLTTLPLALAILSPVWSPGVLMSAEFRLQTLTAGAAIGVAVIAPLFRQLPLRWLTTAATVAGLSATVLALRQFFLVDDAIAAVYADAITLGWGGWLTLAGLSGMVLSVREAWQAARPAR